MYEIDTALSEQMATKYPRLFEVRRCYENAYSLVHREYERGSSAPKLLFCYAYNGQYYYRHCFCLLDGRIIEPLENIRDGLDTAKIVPIAELSFEEYNRLLLQDERFDLIPSLFPREVEAFNAHKTEMVELNPVDLGELVRRTVTTADECMRVMSGALSGFGIVI